jgi:peptide/nickel transport system substrate-binding protein
MTAAAINELTQIGLSVEERKLDRAAWAARRQRPGMDDDWCAVCDSLPGADHSDPFAISAGPGPISGEWPGWPDDPVAARLRDAWIDSPSLSAGQEIAARLQTRVFTTAAFVPLGQWFPVSAWRETITGQQVGAFPVFWDVARKE